MKVEKLSDKKENFDEDLTRKRIEKNIVYDEELKEVLKHGLEISMNEKQVRIGLF